MMGNRGLQISVSFVAILWLQMVASVFGTISTENVHQGGILYPYESETRETKSLNGFWAFKLQEKGREEEWYTRNLAESGPVTYMPVPSSYNDISVDKKIRDHVGLVWYEKRFFVPISWLKLKYRVWLRFDSVHYAAKVWINKRFVMSHEIGHLPFLQEVTEFLQFGKKNKVTVVVDNRLLNTTLPQGMIDNIQINGGRFKPVQSYTFDFFNYAGIHRSVHLYTTPQLYIDDITLRTTIVDQTTGLVDYNVSIKGPISRCSKFTFQADLIDQNGKIVVQQYQDSNVSQVTGRIRVVNAKLWWPYLMHSHPAYLYKLKITIFSKVWGMDVYRLPVGIRELRWNNATFTLNGKPVYFRGFGRHEDSDLRGKGLDYVLIARDYNLLTWIGANSYRTSHYPYAEQIMDKADQLGFLIINECPAVNVENYTVTLLEKHEQSMRELILRDKNRPSVVMWSVANEPRSQQEGAAEYFKAVTDTVRNLDSSRPQIAALDQYFPSDRIGQYLDIIGFNRYYSWYNTTGQLDTIYYRIIEEAKGWHRKYNKPVMVTEYGTDNLAGLHKIPSVVWTEEYELEFLSEHFRAFDTLRLKENFFIGEMIWNFADFNTAQSVTRVDGNKKGVFTRERQPKSAAHLVRQRNWLLAMEKSDIILPKDLFRYVSPRFASGLRCSKN